MSIMKMRSLPFFVVQVLVLFLLVPAIVDAKSEKPQYGGVLRIVDKAEGNQPIGAPWICRGVDTFLQKPVLETLLREDINGNLHPWLATDWTVDATNNNIVVHLRKGVKFHDGTPFNAEAEKWVLDRSIEGKMLSGYHSVDVIDEYTIRINLEEYQNIHLNYLASSRTCAVSPTAFKTMGEEKAKFHPVGTGPFKFVQFRRGDKLVFEKWDGYWKEGLPYLDGIEFLFIRDPMTQMAAMRAKGDEKIHVLSVMSGEQGAMLKAQGFNVLSMPSGPISLEPDSIHDNSPLSNRKVRQAISYAINREAIVKARGFGFWKPTNQIPSPGQSGYVKDLDFGQYDPEKAKKLLKEAGYPNGLKIKIFCMPAMVDREAMIAVQRFLNEVGIDVEVEFPDRGGYHAKRTKDGWHNGFMAQHTRYWVNFNNTYNYFFNTTWWPSMARTPGLIDAIEESLRTPEIEVAKGEAMTKMMAKDAMFIPIYNVYEMYVLQPNVHDTGYSEWSISTVHTPEKTWLSKKK